MKGVFRVSAIFREGAKIVFMSLAVEIAVQNTAGLRIAQEVGAARVELAQALSLGGLTPSPATIESAVDAAASGGTEVHVLIRPRAGDFVYDADEQALMERDVRLALAAGAHGVVVGAQVADGGLDRDELARLVDAAGGASVTLHRAIDMTGDIVASARIARDLGIRRVLTSGGASKASDGLDVLRSLVAEGGIEVMAGSGITASDVAAVAATGVHAVHFSAKRAVAAAGGVKLGSAGDGVGGYEVTDLETAREIVAALAG